MLTSYECACDSAKVIFKFSPHITKTSCSYHYKSSYLQHYGKSGPNLKKLQTRVYLLDDVYKKPTHIFRR